MGKEIIRLSYRQTVNQESTEEFERLVFRQSFDEFATKCQEYNPQSMPLNLAQMIANNPKANSLHYKVALSVFNTIKNLNNIIPKLYDTMGEQTIPFTSYDFRIVDSNPFNQSIHKVAITYTTEPLLLIKNFGEYLLLQTVKDDGVKTFTIKMQSDLAVTEYSIQD